MRKLADGEGVMDYIGRVHPCLEGRGDYASGMAA